MLYCDRDSRTKSEIGTISGVTRWGHLLHMSRRLLKLIHGIVFFAAMVGHTREFTGKHVPNLMRSRASVAYVPQE